MKELDTTEANFCQDELGRIDCDRRRNSIKSHKEVEAWLSWELLQRTILHKNLEMKLQELNEVCGASSTMIRSTVEIGLCRARNKTKQV